MFGMCLAYAGNMFGISLAYAWKTLGISLAYAWTKLGMCLEYSTRQQKIAIALLRWGCQGPGLARDCALRTRAKSNDYAEIADCASIRNEWVTRDCALRLGAVLWS